jgi:predicted cobalt transporter CbtA
VLVIGTAFGGLFALAFAFAYGRIGRVGPRGTSLLIAAAGFLAIYLIPFLKYPANPPSIGQATTIDHRTEIYFGVMLISILTTIGAIIVGRWLTPRFGAWNATLIAAGAFVAITTVVFIVMPGLNEVPAGFPATTLWRFRLGSLATQLTLWAAIGLIFGPLTERSAGFRRQQKLEAFR